MLVLKALVAFAIGIAPIAQANVNNYHRRADARLADVALDGVMN